MNESDEALKFAHNVIEQLQAKLAAAQAQLQEALKLLSALVDNRNLCFIPEDRVGDLYEWTNKAREALAKIGGGK